VDAGGSQTRARRRFDGRTVVVTGGSSGIGAAIVRAFVDDGARVLASGRDRERLDAVRASTSEPAMVEVSTADLRRSRNVRALISDAIESFGRIDVLVNNAGVAPSAPVLELRERQWRETLAVNLDAPFVATQAAARHMVEHGVRGAIVNIASTDAFHAEAPQADYNTSKAALVMMSRSFALELGHLGIRVNCVAPGQTATPMVEEELRRPEFRDAYLRRIPARRVGRPEEIAAVVLFLASDEASFVNGETVVADGGQLTGTWYDVRDEPPAS
jgi:meso-butanediol dehydrogenase / (S,S)-butanediol dehydrogenase / diacetyl reductase